MAVLYDAGMPLTGDELATSLLVRLEPSERNYLEAWDLRRLELKQERMRKHRGTAVTVVKSITTVTTRALPAIVRLWVMDVFVKRVRQGQTLIQDADGRYRPGPKAPRVLTMDGHLVDFTPETRRELEQAEHDEGRAHLALVEWARVTAALDLRTIEAQTQVLILLARRLLIGPQKMPFDERKVGPQFNDLERLADTPAVKRVVLQRALDALWSEG